MKERVWNRCPGLNSEHRKVNKRKSFYKTTHTPVSNRHIVLNLDKLAKRKLTKMKMEVEGKPCTVLLDSCSSANIISENILVNYLNVNRSNIYGPIGCVKGVGKAVTYDLGRIQLKVKVLDNDYLEEFIVIKDPGIPGEVLLSAEAMGRCGITIDFRQRKVYLADCKREVTFCLDDLSYPVNLINLLETIPSEQNRSDLVNGNRESLILSTVHCPTKRENKVNVNGTSNSSCSTESHMLTPIDESSSLIVKLMNEIERERLIETSLVAKLMYEIHYKDSGTPLSNFNAQATEQVNDASLISSIEAIEERIQHAQISEFIESEQEAQDLLHDATEENYLINVTNKYKEIHEVLYLGSFDRQNFVEIEESTEVNNDLIREHVFLSQTAEAELHCVSTNDDDKVKFRLTRSVYLRPNETAKIYLMTVDDDIRIDNKEIILTSDKHLPEGVVMDDNLNVLNGQCCESFICNNTDKRVELLSGKIVCSGIILHTPTLEVKSEAFSSLVSVDEDSLEQEIGQLQFPQGRSKLMHLLKQYRNVLAIEGDKPGRTDVIEHRINLEENAQPFFIPNYRLPISQRKRVEEMIKEMKKENIVRPSKSPYNSPLLLVPKKDGSWRMVIDYRKLNKQTVPERFPMPVINDVLAQLGGAKVFTSLDLMSGYWQIPLEEESKPLTAFSSHNEHLEFNVLPFGLTNAPLAFMRAMMQVLGDLKNVMIYIDDIIIFNEDLETHLQTLKDVLDRLQKAGLKLKVKKCQFLSRELEYLGHKLNSEGLQMQEGKIKAILDYPAPTTIKALRRFLGMIGYYRPFIQNFATKAYPLTNLLKQENDFEWNNEQQQAFESLKECLMKDPILVYPNFQKDFYLACDASGTGLGAVLLQKNKCRMRVISYASRVLNVTEQRYSVTERECLALVWGLKKFRHLILGYKVHILTDHKPLLDLFKRRDFINNQKFNRWFISVLEYGPEFRYIPGKYNTLADGLSRSFEDDEKENVLTLECFTCQIVDLDMELVRREQQKDSQIKEILGDLILDENSRPDFKLIDGIVYKKPDGEQKVARLYIPNSLIQEILHLVHTNITAGHPGIKKTIQTIGRNYFWPHYRKMAENYVHNCNTCQLHKGNVNVPAPLERYPTELTPFQVVAMDFLGPLPTTIRDNKYLLVFIDHLTRYVEIVPVRDRQAATVADALRHRIIVRHSCPQVLISDNAPEFTSVLLNKLCSFYNIKKVEITPWKPSSNGVVERANGRIKSILRTVITPDIVDWDTYVDDVQMVLNNSVNSTVGESPHFLLYGYEKRLPLSLLDEAKPPKQTYNYEDYIENRVIQYYNIVKKTRLKLKEGQKGYEKYYKSAQKKQIVIGTKVYVLKMIREGPNTKVSPKFDGPFRVIEIMPNNKYKLIDEENKEKVAHYNNLKIVRGDSNWKIPSFQAENDPEDDNPGPSDDGLGNRYNLRPRH